MRQQAASLREAELRAAYDLGREVGASWLGRLLFELLGTPGDGERIRRVACRKPFLTGFIEAPRK